MWKGTGMTMTYEIPAKSVDGRRISLLSGEKFQSTLTVLKQTLRQREDGVNRMLQVSFSRVAMGLLMRQRPQS